MDIKKYFSGIFLILFLAFLFRIVNAGAPVIGVHEWRQCDTAAIARNFYENGMDLFHPQIDWAGNSGGFVESEFQIYPFATALLYKVFGFHEFLGRLLSIIISIAGAFYFFLLVREIFGEKPALWAAGVYCILPLNIFYSTSIQPEASFMAASIAGMYYLMKWSSSESVRHLACSGVLISAACLLKLTNLYLGLPVLYVFIKKYGSSLWKKWPVWLYAALVLVPVMLWYHHAHGIFLEYGNTFGIWDYKSGKWLNLEFLQFRFWNKIFFFSIFIKHFAVFGLPLFIAGYSMKRLDDKEMFFELWLLAFFIFVFIAARGHMLHEYYQLPLTAIGSAYIGKFLAQKFETGNLVKIYFAAMIVFSISIYSYYVILQSPSDSFEMKFSAIIKEKIKDARPLIFISQNLPDPYFPDCDPVLLYHAHMKGWTTSAKKFDHTYLAGKIKQGAAYAAGKHSFFKGADGEAKLRMLLSGVYQKLYDDGEKFLVCLQGPHVMK